jgi:glutamate synthase domain-containing protein 2
MSFGSLSGPAVEAINRGCALASALHNTGEGGVARHHLHGGDLIYQIGTGYFGCRDERGHFDLARLKETLAKAPVRAIEIKMSQGAKPGLGGVLPGGKVTAEIAAARGVVPGTTCVSPAHHSAFSSVDEMLDFIEMLAAESGLPVGIKSAVGQMNFWHELVELMAAGGRGPDFITIDGGEGGTGAAPLSFTDHVALPFKAAFPAVFRLFAERGLADSVVFIASGKLGFPETALFAFAMGADMVHLAREAMLAIGCIQAQRCHTNHCPTGVATQNAWLARGLDPTLKAWRLANYLATLRKELLRLSWAVGAAHPALVGLDHFCILNGAFDVREPRHLLAYDPGWGLPSAREKAEILALVAETYGIAV